MTTKIPAVILTRISDDRVKYDKHGNRTEREGLGVADQQTRAREKTEQLGGEVVAVLEENDTSGFKRKRMKATFTYPDGETETTTILRTIRPKFHEALRMLRTGQARMLITLDLDRLTRDPRDLEDLIDVVEHSSPRVVCDSVTGSMRLATDADITMARVMVAMANKSSRDTRRRVADARERRVKNGGNGGAAVTSGSRPTGSPSARPRRMRSAPRAGRCWPPGAAPRRRSPTRACRCGPSPGISPGARCRPSVAGHGGRKRCAPS